MGYLKSIALIFSLVTSLAAQRGCSWLPVDGATATAVGVLWSHGFNDDEEDAAGLARVLAACRLQRVRHAVPSMLASGMLIGGDYALVFGVVSGQEAEQSKTVIATLLDEDAHSDVLTDDLLAVAVAQAALAADDAEFVYPGDVLLSHARTRLGYGSNLARPPAGIASACSSLTPADIRKALRVVVPVRAAVLGALDAATLSAISKLVPAGSEPEARVQLLCTSPQVANSMSEATNDRLDAPFIAASFALPEALDQAAFALGMQVATSRAFRRWRMRGMEQQARAPFVRWSWLHADPIVQFCRRGENPRRLLPGEQAKGSLEGEVSATSDELKAYLDDLVSLPPTEAELDRARVALRARLALPVPGQKYAWASEPATLPGRLQVLLLAAHHGIDVGKIDTLTVAAVHQAVQLALDPKGASWHGLLPELGSEYGYRQR